MMENFANLEKRLVETLGLNAAAIGRTVLERVVSTALERVEVADTATYLERFAAASEDFESCLEELVVPETWFFRDTEPFILLIRHLCETWFPAHRHETLRILSAPCSTGEEPYSIAMTLLEAGIESRQFHLDAVDISRRALAAAQRAVYGKGAFRQPLTAAQELFFSGPPGERQLAETVTRTVHFFRANLVAPDFLAGQAPYHIIFCKNLLIYLTDEARRQVFANLCRLLAPEGILFTGHAEMGLLQQHGFTAIRHTRSFAGRRAALPAAPLPRPDALPAAFPLKAGLAAAAPPRQPAPPMALPKLLPQVDTAEALRAEAQALADRGLFEEADALCRRYLREQPPHADVYCLLALIHEAAKRYGEARECYEKALYLNPGHHETLIHLSLLCRQGGDAQKAALYRERAATTARRLHGRPR